MIHTQDPDLTLYQGDALEVLRSLPAESVHCVVTSPPYWGLRDYGTGAWEGGDAECDHRKVTGESAARSLASSTLHNPSPKQVGHVQEGFGAICGRCGAKRTDNQLGLEPTPEAYVTAMVEVFREVRRVLRSDGSLWLNIGDSYWGGGGGSYGEESKSVKGREGVHLTNVRNRYNPDGLKPKDLCMIPARLALALQADGWYLRSQIVWSKPNPMPESVTDRPTTSHEFVYLLAKSKSYFFDQEAVREPALRFGDIPGGDNERGVGEHGVKPHAPFNGAVPAGRNLRSVWEIPTQPYPEAHFATYPEELVRRCILAGTSERGCCPECGAPWVREVESERLSPAAPSGNRERGRWDGDPEGQLGGRRIVRAVGWRPSCECFPSFDVLGTIPATVQPCTVLDPFGGSGTTALVARKHGRRSILIELSESYCDLAARRLQQLSLLSA